MAADDERIYVASQNEGRATTSSRIAAYSLDGTPLWERAAGGDPARIAMGPAGGLIVVANMGVTESAVSFFDHRCGKLLWRREHAGMGVVSRTIRVDTFGRIAVLSHRRNEFMKINTYSPQGELLWTYDFEPAWSGGFDPAVAASLKNFGPIGADGVLYVMRSDPKPVNGEPPFHSLLEGIDMRTGRRVLRYELPKPGYVGTQALLLDNGLLVTTLKHVGDPQQLIAIQTLSPGLAHSPWPTYCANNVRSCNDSLGR